MTRRPKRDAVTVGDRVRLPDAPNLYPDLRNATGTIVARRGRRGAIRVDLPVGSLLNQAEFDLGPDGIATFAELRLLEVSR
jgi:hypothetical protein